MNSKLQRHQATLEPYLISESTLAYVAGLFDGEGYIRFSFGPHWHGRKMNTDFFITVTNTNGPVLQWLRMMFGGSVYACKPRSENHKDVYFWRVTTRKAFMVLGRIAPYLKIKRKQANLLLVNKTLISKKGPKSDSDREKMIALTKEMVVLGKEGELCRTLKAEGDVC